MMKERNQTLVWSWCLLFLHGIAIVIFVIGFLLTRTELPFRSNCSDYSHLHCSYSHDSFSDSISSDSSSQNNYCWSKPTVDRLIIIIFDALRFDFVAPSTFFRGRDNLCCLILMLLFSWINDEPKPWMDKLPMMSKMAFSHEHRAHIFKAIADPPTTSLQRLKGLVTGGLPTFIDIGNSFGAPEIVEDNFINQLIQNGKRVLMMGDDTWIRCFPNHFNKSYPFPSFNVKDLHTVDDGCIDHLIPSLYEEDWDVLIAHFLGVDHAGHIFGVDSIPMIEKLEQYNSLTEKIIDVLERNSGIDGIHEGTFLIVMGDHGQTLNGDHGGGSPEEVETSIFAMRFGNSSSHTNFAKFETSILPAEPTECRNAGCIPSIHQIDFAATFSALLGIPIPFGSIGRVNKDIYALTTNPFEFGNSKDENHYLATYANILCVNSWQVKRYIDSYSSASQFGFSVEDISNLENLYTQANENWSYITNELLSVEKEHDHLIKYDINRQIDLYSDFLKYVAEMARAKWTEFNLKMMVLGLGVLLASVFVHMKAIMRFNNFNDHSFLSFGESGSVALACFIISIRTTSLFSNSYILEEGKVAIFLLATTGIYNLRTLVLEGRALYQVTKVIKFLAVVTICRFFIEAGLLKQGATSLFLKTHESFVLGVSSWFPVWKYVVVGVPHLALFILAYLQFKTYRYSKGILRIVSIITVLCYILISLHWGAEGKTWSFGSISESITKNIIPRTIYACGIMMFFLVMFHRILEKDKFSDFETIIFTRIVAILSSFGPVVIILSGEQGSIIALASLIGGYYIVRLSSTESNPNTGIGLFSITQWSLFSTCLFFSSGHWCSFDGLHYGAAFIGFDEFIPVPQAVLLTIETFGFSHIFSIFGLAFLVVGNYIGKNVKVERKYLLRELTRVYLIYGLIISVTMAHMMLCVMIHRRHLMMWGLFAPKFVFEVMSLIIADFLISLALLLYT